MSNRIMEIPELAGLHIRLTDGSWVHFIDPDDDEPQPAATRPKPVPPRSPIRAR